MRWRRTAALLVVGLVLGAGACSDDGDADDGSSDTSTTTPSDGGEAGGGETGSIDVLTYNVAGLPQEISDENPSEHMQLISPLLSEYDLVLLQESFDWWLPGGLVETLDLDAQSYVERLRADSGLPHALPQHPGPEEAGIDPATRPDLQLGDGIGIMSRFELADPVRQAWVGCFGGFDTSDGGAADCLAMKGFAVATIELGGVEVDVYSLHGEAGGTDTDQGLQVDDFAQLAAFIEERSAGRPIILGGDTNLHTRSDHPDADGDADTRIWDDFIEATGLSDACVETDCEEVGSIDKVAVRSTDDLALAVTSYDQPVETFTSPAGDELSDHPPVAVTIEWTRP